MEKYRTVRQAGEAEWTVKRSRFIGRAMRVEREEEAQEWLKEIRRRHWDAAHHCYAYIIGRGGEIQRSSDDGEPAGTAGRPILEVLHQLELRDVLVVVTRYFGGVLLGAGGLVRAYSRAASEAVRAAGVVTRRPGLRVRLRFAYPHYGRIAHLLHEAGWPADEPVYGEDVCLTAYVPEEEAARLREVVADATRGQGEVFLEGPAWLEDREDAGLPPDPPGPSPEG